jgi:hypothetical protein
MISMSRAEWISKCSRAFLITLRNDHVNACVIATSNDNASVRCTTYKVHDLQGFPHSTLQCRTAINKALRVIAINDAAK